MIARILNTAGARQIGPYEMDLPHLVRQCLAGGPITVYDNGT